MRTVKITLKQIRTAMEKAHQFSDDWQAELCEILRIPAIARRWQELNPTMPGLRLDFIPGRPHKNHEPEDNLAHGEAQEWHEFAGYVLVLSVRDWGGKPGEYTWNRVRSDWYGHSASTAWNGVRRDTISQFADDLRMIALGHDHPEARRSLDRVKIQLT